MYLHLRGSVSPWLISRSRILMELHGDGHNMPYFTMAERVMNHGISTCIHSDVVSHSSSVWTMSNMVSGLLGWDDQAPTRGPFVTSHVTRWCNQVSPVCNTNILKLLFAHYDMGCTTIFEKAETFKTSKIYPCTWNSKSFIHRWSVDYTSFPYAYGMQQYITT